MIWLIMLSMLGFLGWAVVLTYIKLDVGWMQIPGVGIVPVPLPFWGAENEHLVLATNICIVCAFVFYDAVNLEEALYWIFLLQSIKKTNTSRRTQRITRWVNSRIFWIWLALAILGAIAHILIPFAEDWTDNIKISVRLFLFEGGSGVVNVVLSIILAYYLPGFIKQVAENGGSQDVLSKLSFFNGESPGVLARLPYPYLTLHCNCLRQK